MKKLSLLLTGVFLLVSNCAYSQRDFLVLNDCTAEEAAVVSHSITSGSVTLGISDIGGGVINQLSLPGVTDDIMGLYTDRWGRAGSTSIRSGSSTGLWNPTQGGFSAYGGTHCHVESEPGKLIVSRRPCATFRSKGGYDICEWENLGDDGYKNDGGNTDEDLFDESSLIGKQATEVTSETDFYCTYEDYMGTAGVDIPCFRWYWEYIFAREAGHMMGQYGPGSEAWNPDALGGDISNSKPAGVHPGTEDNIAGMNADGFMRADYGIWDPGYRHWLNFAEEWQTEPAGTEKKVWYWENENRANPGFISLMILSDSADRDTGPAIGVYKPHNSIINEQQIVGDGYTDDRRRLTMMAHSPRRTYGMLNWGFPQGLRGMLSPNETPNNAEEKFRQEIYILIGTPNEIWANVQKISLTNTEAPNNAPVFTNDPMTGTTAEKDLAYSQSLAGTATDADSDSLIYMKVLGPTWLHVASDGSLTGTPGASDVGSNQFTVKVSDHHGGSADASLNIIVEVDSYELTVYSGSGSGSYTEGALVIIIANEPPQGQEFTAWTGDVDHVADVNDDTTTITMPASAVELTATFTDITSNDADRISFEASAVQLYPNPANSTVHIETTEASEVKVYNVVGQMIYNKQEAATSHNIDVSNWKSGVYFVKVQCAGKVFNQKLIVE